MAVITSIRESILAQEFCNKVSGVSPGKKDRQSIFEFTQGAKNLGIWDNLIIWPSRSVHNSTDKLFSLGGLANIEAVKASSNISVQNTGAVSVSAAGQFEAPLPLYLNSDYFNASGFCVFYCTKTDNHGVISRINVISQIEGEVMPGGTRIYRSLSLDTSTGNRAHQMRINHIPDNFISRTGGWPVPAFFNRDADNASFQIHQFNYNPNSSFTSLFNGVSCVLGNINSSTTFVAPSAHIILAPLSKTTGQLEATFGRLNYTGTPNPTISGVTAFYGIIPNSNAPNLYRLLRNTLVKDLSLPELSPLSGISQPPTKSNYEYLNTEFNNSGSVQSDTFYENSRPEFSPSFDYLIGNLVPVPENSRLVLDIPFTNSAVNPPADQSGFNRPITNVWSPVIQSTVIRSGKSFAGESRGRANNDPAGPAHSLGHWSAGTRTAWNSLTGSFGVECWVYLPAANRSYALDTGFGEGPFITDHNAIWGLGGPDSNGPGLHIYNNSTLTDTRLRINLGDNDGTTIEVNEQFPLDRWVHTCLIHKKTISKTLLYVDGRIILENYGLTFTSSGGGTFFQVFNIGARDNNNYRGFNRPLRGYLSNFRIYHSI